MKLRINIIILILIIILLLSINFNSLKDGLAGPEGQNVYSIVKNNLCLDADTLSMAPCSKSNNQLWYSNKVNNFNKIISYDSSNCLSVLMSSPYNYDLSMEPCSNTNTQEWLMPPNNPYIDNAFAAGNCLDLSSNKLYMSSMACMTESGRKWSLHTFKNKTIL
jgi:hypothetical protein